MTLSHHKGMDLAKICISKMVYSAPHGWSVDATTSIHGILQYIKILGSVLTSPRSNWELMTAHTDKEEA